MLFGWHAWGRKPDHEPTRILLRSPRQKKFTSERKFSAGREISATTINFFLSTGLSPPVPSGVSSGELVQVQRTGRLHFSPAWHHGKMGLKLSRSSITRRVAHSQNHPRHLGAPFMTASSS